MVSEGCARLSTINSRLGVAVPLMLANTASKPSTSSYAPKIKTSGELLETGLNRAANAGTTRNSAHEALRSSDRVPPANNP